jgi:predicted Zn finger-like uncharacterized protein
MIVTCKECDTSFNFDDHLIKPSGSKVRCSKCHAIFVAFPSASQEPAEAGSKSEATAAIDGVAGGLDDLDLDEIQKSLDLEENDGAGSDSPQAVVSDDLDFDLDLDEDVAPEAASAGTEFDETQELDLSDFDLDESSKAETAAPETADLDFDLDLDADTSTSAPAQDLAGGDTVDSEEAEDLGFDLDLEFDEETGTADADDSPAEADESADLDFGLDLDLDEEEETTTSETGAETAEPDAGASDDLDFDLDFDLEGDEDTPGESAVAEADDTPEVSDDLDFSIDLDEDTSADTATPMAVDETIDSDFEDVNDFLDLDDENGADAEPAEPTEAVDDLDFDLDMDLDAEEGAETTEVVDSDDLDFGQDLEAETDDLSFDDAPLDLDETEELDLADLDGMIEGDDEASEEAATEPAEDDIDLDLDLAMETAEEGADSDLILEETDELDLTGLEDELEIEEEQPIGETAEEADDLDLELDFGEDVAASSDDVAATMDLDDETGDFDLSDLDGLPVIEDGAAVDAGGGGQDFDLELDIEGQGDEEDAEFEYEADDNLAPVSDDTLDESAVAKQADPLAETFDMGNMPEMGEAVDAGDEEEYFDEEAPRSKPKKAAAKGLSRPVKLLLVLFLLAGGGYGAVTLAQFFGINLPYLDTIKNVEIPFVSDFFGPKVKDAGNLRIAIVENQLKGAFIQNANLGTLYVVKGKVKNNYDHRRNYISITGKLYSEGGKPGPNNTIYAGNMLSEKQLASLNKAQIDKRLNNRRGAKRSNMNVNKGKVIPFMIVFFQLPQNLDEYSVEVAASAKSKK